MLRVASVVASGGFLVVAALLSSAPVAQVQELSGEGTCPLREWSEAVGYVLAAPAPVKRIDLLAGGFKTALSCAAAPDQVTLGAWPDGVVPSQQVPRQEYSEVRVILEDRVVLLAATLPAQDHIDLGVTFLDGGGFHVMEGGQTVEVRENETVMGHAILEWWSWGLPMRPLADGEHGVEMPVLTGWNRGIAIDVHVDHTNPFQGNIEDVGKLAGGVTVDLVAPNGTVVRSVALSPPWETGDIRLGPLEKGTWRMVVRAEGADHGQWDIVYGVGATLRY